MRKIRLFCKSFLKHDVAVVTEFKKNTIIPETCSTEGSPNVKLVIHYFGMGSIRKQILLGFRQMKRNVSPAPRSNDDEKQFGFSFEESPFFYGPVPQGSELQKKMVKFRKQVELSISLSIKPTHFRYYLALHEDNGVQSFFIMNTFRPLSDDQQIE
uniref:Uncharacterized protein n=1 Tax=Anaerobacillus isosaccharinicus TaxID=1532552 RepID=A0A7S7L4Y6_9BACI|nr:hypothetical protein [Anaerobacillus isosaccharinicus]QOY34485.1 hypothetical protein AWH56_017390 [Anaerobacillus isosaccharinicus]